VNEPAGIVASEWKASAKGSRLGFVKLTLLRTRLRIHGAMLHGMNDSVWISLPSREWVDPKTGEIHHSVLIDFADDAAKTQFYAKALEAVRTLLGDKFPKAAAEGRAERVSPFV
jgi:hypothetical protein